jgi:hypothetical protein
MRMAALDYVSTMTPDQVVACIADEKPGRYYTEIISFHISRCYYFEGLARSSSDNNTSTDIPRGFDRCGSYVEYIAQLDVDVKTKRTQLSDLLQILQDLRDSIGRAAVSGHLTATQLKTLYIKMEAFGRRFGQAAILCGAEERELIKMQAESWWYVLAELLYGINIKKY